MIQKEKPVSILLVDDDEDYYYLAKEAFHEAGITNNFFWVKAGDELFQYLATQPRPRVILLDLNMPKMDGFQVLEKLKQDPQLRQIPVVILTTSRSEADALRSYNLGAASFISKPIDFLKLVELVQTFKKYWFQVAELPAG